MDSIVLIPEAIIWDKAGKGEAMSVVGCDGDLQFGIYTVWLDQNLRCEQ